jgi:hypothetical protein
MNIRRKGDLKMENREKDCLVNGLQVLQEDCIHTQKKGLHFIISSIIIWMIIFVVQLLPIAVNQKNLLTFCSSAILLPLALFFSKILDIKFSDKSNPLNDLGFLFTMNQMLYLLIVMWVFSTNQKYMVMVYAMVFGAHLLPYSWLYKSMAYKVISIAATIGALFFGLFIGSNAVAGYMVIVEAIFTIWLYVELKKLSFQEIISSIMSRFFKR